MFLDIYHFVLTLYPLYISNLFCHLISLQGDSDQAKKSSKKKKRANQKSNDKYVVYSPDDDISSDDDYSDSDSYSDEEDGHSQPVDEDEKSTCDVV